MVELDIEREYNLEINYYHSRLEGEINVIYQNADDILSIMEVGEYFTTKEIVKEFSIIGRTVINEGKNMKKRFKLPQDIEKKIDNIIKEGVFFHQLTGEEANKKIINKAKNIKRLISEIIKSLFKLSNE